MTVLIVALAGGVGAARFLTGLTKIVDSKDLVVIANTGDDIEHFGLHISPDIDIVSYTLAGLVDEEKGWGIKGDTFYCLGMLQRFGCETWFGLGDQDLATHIYRTNRLRQGATLSQITIEFCSSLGLKLRILPMSNDKFETKIKTPNGTIHFEEYLVKRQAQDLVLGVEFDGAATARPSEGVLEAILEAEKIVVCPSNPVVSIGTILTVDGIRDALKRTNAKKIAVTPIVSGLPVKGPADKIMRGLNLEVSAFGVAKLYSDFLDGFVLDHTDALQKERIEKLGLKVVVTNTLMTSLERKVTLAQAVLDC